MGHLACMQTLPLRFTAITYTRKFTLRPTIGIEIKRVRPELIPLSGAWSDWEYFYSPLDGMLVHQRGYPHIKFAGTYVHIWVAWGETLWELSVLPKNITTCTRPELELGRLDRGTNALTYICFTTMWPPRLKWNINRLYTLNVTQFYLQYSDYTMKCEQGIRKVATTKILVCYFCPSFTQFCITFVCHFRADDSSVP